MNGLKNRSNLHGKNFAIYLNSLTLVISLSLGLGKGGLLKKDALLIALMAFSSPFRSAASLFALKALFER